MASGCCPLAKAWWVLLSGGSHHSAPLPVGKREAIRLLKLPLELHHVASTTFCRSQQVSEAARFQGRHGIVTLLEGTQDGQAPLSPLWGLLVLLCQPMEASSAQHPRMAQCQRL